MSNITSSLISDFESSIYRQVMDYGTVRLGKDEKIEAIQHPESFILTCEYCGTSHRVKDDFSCPACGAPFNMKKVTALPMMVFSELDADSMATQGNGEARRKWPGIKKDLGISWRV